MKIIGLGKYVPERILPNEEIQKTVNTSSEWIKSKLGISERRISNSDEKTSDLAFKASLKALKSCNNSIDDIDLIIVATSTPDRKSPSTACILQEKFDCKNIPAFDINAVCSGFIYGLDLCNSLLNENKYNKILLVGAEQYSTITNWESRDCVFFGDGAGAVVLEKDETSFFKSIIKADGKGKENFTVPSGEKYFKMNGKEVFKHATNVLPSSIKQLLHENNLKSSDIALCVPHQPSIRILELTAKKIGLSFDKIARTMHKYANTAGASIPVTLCDAFEQGRLKKGDLILFTAVGSGWTWGSAIIRWAI